MSKPTVSIITVVFNGAVTLEDTIKSVGGQSFTDREYIIVDGGSGDATLQIIKKYAGGVVTSWSSEPDKGIYDAMNKGIRMAKGEWLYFLGSDDAFLHAGVLQEFFAADLKDVDLAYGDVYSKDYNGRYDGPFTLKKLLSKNLSHQAAFYRKAIFDRLGDFNLLYRQHADWDFNLRCFSDPYVRTRYTGVLVANFGIGGVSAGHDIAFLREKLIPAKLHELMMDGSHPLRRIAYYDEWWRFLRNARITRLQDLRAADGKGPLPKAIQCMIRLQRLVPYVVLRRGPFSKCLMVMCYVFSGLTGVL